MPQLVRVIGIGAEGRHGASDGERNASQRFTVDVEAVVEARDDDLATTADYRDIVARTREVIETESHTIIETVAERVAGAVAAVDGVLSCRATVHKPAAAGRLQADDISAEATAERP